MFIITTSQAASIMAIADDYGKTGTFQISQDDTADDDFPTEWSVSVPLLDDYGYVNHGFLGYYLTFPTRERARGFRRTMETFGVVATIHKPFHAAHN